MLKNDIMHAIWLSYQQLNPDIKRCVKYCNVFPKRSKLNKDELVHLWIAQGFIKTNCATEDMEDVAEGYVQELVSCSFVQPEEDDYSIKYITILDLLHDLLDEIVERDYFRIENARNQRGIVWKGDVPRDVCHLFVQNYDGELITKKILALENLRTLIIYVVEKDTPVEEKVIESVCNSLPKLRVLAVAFSREHHPITRPNKFSIPESISQLKHLCYLAFRTFKCTVILPSALAELHHIQLLDFGHHSQTSEFTTDNLTNLRYIMCQSVKCPNIGRLISLQALPCNTFTVRNVQGYEIKQLRDLNKLRGNLVINCLENVTSKEEALESNLAAKKRVKELSIRWTDGSARWCSPEVEAKVLEGMCPPADLETLMIEGYKGSRYPDWMVDQQNSGPKDLQNLELKTWSQPGPGPELEAFPHLRMLRLVDCSWVTLPGNMEHLTSLKHLDISLCWNIRLLPTLPRSLEYFYLSYCNDDFIKSCGTDGHPNCRKLEHVHQKEIIRMACKTVVPIAIVPLFFICKHYLRNIFDLLLLCLITSLHPFATH
ncbi:hypothetical protein CFC21_004630 [Triticum aestivum]|uniref:NB-ARC domain-containing protein n=2 Tax=Triticum aestivum TaxID=4565 RepID=A0A9R1IN85_WHEAT|nr:hypothetical protein CFC21_004630 [Triticum aestivum]